MAARVQAGLERVYRLDRVADVGDFVAPGDTGEREALIVRQSVAGGIEIAVRLPSFPAAQDGSTPLDAVCQIIEGVSHFVYVAERARVDREATQLELEVQAEVDKWVILAGSMRVFDADRSAELRSSLYERIVMLHDQTTEDGERYRVANDVANRFVRRLERECVVSGRFAELRDRLCSFFNLGQEEKLRLGRAA